MNDKKDKPYWPLFFAISAVLLFNPRLSSPSDDLCAQYCQSATPSPLEDHSLCAILLLLSDISPSFSSFHLSTTSLSSTTGSLSPYLSYLPRPERQPQTCRDVRWFYATIWQQALLFSYQMNQQRKWAPVIYRSSGSIDFLVFTVHQHPKP